MISAAASCPGTCGELFQGTAGGVYCLVSCPIDRFSAVEVAVSDGEGLKVPEGMTKTLRAMEAFLRGRPSTVKRYTLERLEALPEGKGYASSTADILAALTCLSTLEEVPISPEEATAIALSVEPTDSTAWRGLALLDHREGRVMEFLGPAPSMAVLVLDRGGAVDTEAFNRRDMGPYLASRRALHEESLALIRQGVEDGDPEMVGRGATLSAKASAELLGQAFLEECLELCGHLGGYGVCGAHSGTLFGILLPPEAKERREEIAQKTARLLTPGWRGELRSLISGGPRIDERNDGP